MNYVAELKKQTINCNFKYSDCNASTLNVHLRSQFIRGIRDNNIREKLLQLPNLINFEEVVNVASITVFHMIYLSKCQN